MRAYFYKGVQARRCAYGKKGRWGDEGLESKGEKKKEEVVLWKDTWKEVYNHCVSKS